MATVVYVEIGPAWNRGRAIASRDAIVAALRMHGGTSAQVLATGPDEDAALQALLPLLQAG
ncbi:hypothetical protein [Burkholderia territorii]|uniref:hypothetical protein n=1 Tax=Burkholderia territorii TaxID=1503055 RepID=UPI000AE2B022|nr:hypothetical protein [Burkholderia territorii]